MDKYHIYEEIGKGEFSQVFKGREKKKIEYVAIKRIEKSMMNQIVNEVQIIHKLDNPHILRFYDWYETRNNLWLILEYCTGGDLNSLLKRDGYLPETSVRMFGLDIVNGLKYLHSLGVIHCDLRPSNFLIDEYGIVKISDFKCSRKIPKAPLGDAPINTRGAVPYLAPELFASNGVHSFQSDFWALGCVLYELRRGVEPFGGNDVSVEQLLNRIRTVEPVQAPINFLDFNPDNDKSNLTHSRGKEKRSQSTADKAQSFGSGVFKSAVTAPSMTAELADLISWLLEKAPMYRCSWSELCAHPFWGRDANIVAPSHLPPQAIYDAFVRDMERELADKIAKEAIEEVGLDNTDEIIQPPHNPQDDGAPLPPRAVDSTPVKPPNTKTLSSKRTAAHTEDRNVSLPSKPESLIITNETSVIKVPIHDTVSTNNDRNSIPSASATVNPTLSANVGAKAHPEATSQRVDPLVSTTNKTNPHIPSNMSQQEQQQQQQQHMSSWTNNISQIFSPFNLIINPSDTQVKPIVGNKSIETIERPAVRTEVFKNWFKPLTAEDCEQLPQQQLEMHLTMIYRALQKQETTTVDKNQILAYICSISSVPEVANTILNTHFLQALIRILRTSSTPKSSSSNPTAILNGRCLAATVLAMLIRFATYIAVSSPNSSKASDQNAGSDHILLLSLIDLLRELPSSPSFIHETNSPRPTKVNMISKLKRRAIAAFGELIFYVTAQDEELSSTSGNTAEGDVNEKWNLPLTAVQTLLLCLRDDDECVCHYAAKTIENVMAQGGFEHKAKIACSMEIVSRLLELAQTSRNDVLQATCGMAVGHIFYHVLIAVHLQLNQTNPVNVLGSSGRFVARALEQTSGGNMSYLIEPLRDGAPKLQQAYLNIINIIFSVSIHNISNPQQTAEEVSSPDSNALRSVRSYLIRSSALVNNLIRLSSGSSPTIRSKALICLQYILMHHLLHGEDPKATSELLVSLAEKRLTNVLAKGVDSIMQSNQTQAPSPSNTPVPNNIASQLVFTVDQLQNLSYMAKTSVCFISYLKDISCNTLLMMLDDMKNLDMEKANPQITHKTPIKSTRRDADNTPSTIVRHRTPQRNTSEEDLLDYDSQRDHVIQNLNDDLIDSERELSSKENKHIPSFEHHCQAFLAVVSIISPQPMLRRLFIAPKFENENPDLNLIRLISRGFQSYKGLIRCDENLNADVLNVLEQALLCALELIGQIQVDIAEDIDSQSASTASSNYISLIPNHDVSKALTHSIVHHILPAVTDLSPLVNENTRTVITTVLRKLVPALLRTLLKLKQTTTTSTLKAIRLNRNDDLNEYISDPMSGLACLLSRINLLLSHAPPVPQYIIRMLFDCLLLENGFAYEMIIQLESNQCILKLLELFKIQSFATSNMVNNQDLTLLLVTDVEDLPQQDPQLPMLLRVIFDLAQSQEDLKNSRLSHAEKETLSTIPVMMLQNDLCISSASALVSLGSFNADSCHRCTDIAFTLGIGISSANASTSADSLLPLLDMILSQLAFTMRMYSTNRTRNDDQLQANINSIRKSLTPFRSICHVLFNLLTAVQDQSNMGLILLPGTIYFNHGMDQQTIDTLNLSTFLGLHESVREGASRILGSLFDLFPDSLIQYCLDTKDGNGLDQPKQLFAMFLIQPQFPLRTRLRLMKILHGIVNMASSLGNALSSKIRSFMLSQPLHKTLRLIASFDGNMNSSTRMDQIIHETEPDLDLRSAYVTMANHILQITQSL